MSAAAHLPVGWSPCCPQEHLLAAKSFPWELGFPLPFIAGYSHQALQWSGGRLGKTVVKFSVLSCGLSEAAWEAAEGGTSVI